MYFYAIIISNIFEIVNLKLKNITLITITIIYYQSIFVKIIYNKSKSRELSYRKSIKFLLFKGILWFFLREDKSTIYKKTKIINTII